MTSFKFMLAVKLILGIEAGLVDDPDDPGKITNHGISLKAFPKLGEKGIKALTKNQAAKLYYKYYWKPISGDSLPGQISLCVFDCAVNQGPQTAIKLLQESLGVETDGIIGLQTLTALKNKDEDWVLQEFLALRQFRYINTKNFSKYGKGWFRRMFKVCQTATIARLILSRLR